MKINLRNVKKIKTSAGVARSIKVGNSVWNYSAPTISDYYGIGPGKIAIHINSDDAILDGNGRVTALVNKGGAGSHFNANIVGTPIVLNPDRTISVSPSTGTPRLSNLADIMNVRFMFVISFDNLVTNDRLFGGSDVSNSRYEIQHIVAGDGRRRIRAWSNVTGTGNATNQGWETLPTSGLHLVEIELTNNLMRVWIDGTERNSASSLWANVPFPIDFVGAPWNGIGGITAKIGDVLGVTLGADSAYAIATARAALIEKYSNVVIPETNISEPISTAATLLFAGHSFVQTGWGGTTADGQHGGILYTQWPGSTLSDFVGFGSARQVWNLNGNARNSNYDAVIVSEIADLSAGFPAPGSAMNETLQTWYWNGLEAKARNAELILLQPWSPEFSDLDAGANAFFAYARKWLQDHLDIPVYVIPAGAFVRAIRPVATEGVFSDSLHLRGPFARGVSYLIYSFLTKQRCPFVQAGDAYIDNMAWQVLQDSKHGGFDGAVGADAASIADPLPTPAGLP